MSFRELRNFAEIMRALGYPRLIFIDNFRSPNFELVADMLYWLVKRYNQDIIISDNIETENDRVEFLIGVSHALISKAHITLNPRKLYCADGRAVQELLKLATVLYKALQADDDLTGNESFEIQSGPLNSQLSSIKEARVLAGEITECGARLYDLLGKENHAKQVRLQATTFLEAASTGTNSSAEKTLLEGTLKELIEREKENISDLLIQTKEFEADERLLNSKIQKAQADVDRSEARLRSLKTHRPAFADELEKLEEELQRHYEVYMVRYRNLDYLTQELEKYAELEKLEMDEHQRRRNRNAEKVRKEQLAQFIRRDSTNEAAIDVEIQRARIASCGSQDRSSSQGLFGENRGIRQGIDRQTEGPRTRIMHSESDIESSIAATEDEISIDDSDTGSGTILSDENDSYNGEQTRSLDESDYNNF